VIDRDGEIGACWTRSDGPSCGVSIRSWGADRGAGTPLCDRSQHGPAGADFQLPDGTLSGEVQEVGADRLRHAGRLVEDGLRIGEQPRAVRLAGVLLDADRVDDEEQPAAGTCVPGSSESPGAVCGAGHAAAATANTPNVRRRPPRCTNGDPPEQRSSSPSNPKNSPLGGQSSSPRPSGAQLFRE
jgi:hypothetical protein